MDVKDLWLAQVRLSQYSYDDDNSKSTYKEISVLVYAPNEDAVEERIRKEYEVIDLYGTTIRVDRVRATRVLI